MSDVGIFESETHGSNEAFMFWWFTSKVLSNKADLVNSTLPTFALSLSRTNDLKHLGFSHRLDLLHRHRPLACLLFTLLLDHIGEDFGVALLFSVHEISRDCSFLNILHSALGVLFLVLLDGFLHLDLLLEAFLIEELGLDALEGLCLLGNDLGLTGFFLATLLLSIETFSEPLLVQIHIVVLRHLSLLKSNYNSCLQL